MVNWENAYITNYNELYLYLKRHQINYNLVRVNREIDKLGELIQKKRDKGEVVDKLEKLHYDLLQEFRHEVNELEQ